MSIPHKICWMSYVKGGNRHRVRGSHHAHIWMDRLQKTNGVAGDNLRETQQRQKQQYDKNVGEYEFQVGQKVLVLLPSSTSKILTCWQGLFQIIRIGLVDYEVLHPDPKKKKIPC